MNETEMERELDHEAHDIDESLDAVFDEVTTARGTEKPAQKAGDKIKTIEVQLVGASRIMSANGQLTNDVLAMIPHGRDGAEFINRELERRGSAYRVSVEPLGVKEGYEGYHESVTITRNNTAVSSVIRGEVRPSGN